MSEIEVPRKYRNLRNNKVVLAWTFAQVRNLQGRVLSPQSKLVPFLEDGILSFGLGFIEIMNHQSGFLERWADEEVMIVLDDTHLFGLRNDVFRENHILLPVNDVDPVNHPAHYTRGKIEVWDFIIDQELNYCSGNIVKYVCRAGEKSSETHIQDLEKAKAYLEREIRRVKEK